MHHIRILVSCLLLFLLCCYLLLLYIYKVCMKNAVTVWIMVLGKYSHYWCTQVNLVCNKNHYHYPKPQAIVSHQRNYSFLVGLASVLIKHNDSNIVKVWFISSIFNLGSQRIIINRYSIKHVCILIHLLFKQYYQYMPEFVHTKNSILGFYVSSVSAMAEILLIWLFVS